MQLCAGVVVDGIIRRHSSLSNSVYDRHNRAFPTGDSSAWTKCTIFIRAPINIGRTHNYAIVNFPTYLSNSIYSCYANFTAYKFIYICHISFCATIKHPDANDRCPIPMQIIPSPIFTTDNNSNIFHPAITGDIRIKKSCRTSSWPTPTLIN